jgi:hypothetical protein
MASSEKYSMDIVVENILLKDIPLLKNKIETINRLWLNTPAFASKIRKVYTEVKLKTKFISLNHTEISQPLLKRVEESLAHLYSILEEMRKNCPPDSD